MWRECNTKHILSECTVALTQGRYKWRHDKVLKEIALSIDTKIKENAKRQTGKKRLIQFVKAGQKGEKENFQQESYLSEAKDWKLTADLERGLRIPNQVCITNLRPDIIFVSNKSKQMGIVELKYHVKCELKYQEKSRDLSMNK